MKRLLIITMFIICSISIFSQQKVLYFPLKHHIITLDDGTGGLDVSEIPLIMQELNRAFAPAGIQFKKNINIKFFMK